MRPSLIVAGTQDVNEAIEGQGLGDQNHKGLISSSWARAIHVPEKRVIVHCALGMRRPPSCEYVP